MKYTVTGSNTLPIASFTWGYFVTSRAKESSVHLMKTLSKIRMVKKVDGRTNRRIHLFKATIISLLASHWVLERNQSIPLASLRSIFLSLLIQSSEETLCFF